MFRLISSCFIVAITVAWLIFRRLKELPLFTKLIFLGISGIFFFRPLVGEGFFPCTDMFFQGAIFLLALTMLLYKTLKQKEQIIISPLDKPFLIFIAVLVFSFFSSVQKEISLSMVIYFLSLFLWYWTIINLPENSRFKKILLAVLIFAAILIAAYALYQFLFGFSVMREFAEENPQYLINSSEFQKRFNSNVVFSTFLYPPALASYLVLIFLVTLGLFFSDNLTQGKKRFFPLKNVFFSIFLFLLMLVIILTRSKGGWLSLFAGLMFFSFLSRERKTAWRKVVIFCLVFILLFTLIGFSKKILLPDAGNFIASFKVRIEYWKAAWQMIQERPLLGFGPGTFGDVYPAFKTKIAEETIMAHNSYLQLWSETGILGLGVFVYFWIKLLVCGYNTLKNETASQRIIFAGFYSAIAGFLIHNLVDFDLYLSQNTIVVFGVIGIFILLNKEEKIPLKKELILSNKNKLLLNCLSFILFIVIAAYFSCNITAGQFAEQARGALKNKNFNQAMVLLEKAALFNRFSARYHFQQALIAETQIVAGGSGEDFKKKFIKKAVVCYQEAIRRDYYRPYYHFRFGQFLFMTGRQKQGLLEIQKATSLYPMNPFYHEQLSRFYDIIKKFEPAEKEKLTAEELKKYYVKGTR